MCINFIYNWQDLQFKEDSEHYTFEKLFMAILFTLRVFARNLLRESSRINIFIFSFWCLTCDLNSGLTSNKPTHYLLDYGDCHYYLIILFINVPIEVKIWFVAEDNSLIEIHTPRISIKKNSMISKRCSLVSLCRHQYFLLTTCGFIIKFLVPIERNRNYRFT